MSSKSGKKKPLSLNFHWKRSGRDPSPLPTPSERDEPVDQKTWNLAMVRAMTSQELADLFVCGYLIHVTRPVEAILSGAPIKSKMAAHYENVLINFNETVERFLYILSKHKTSVQAELHRGAAVPVGRDWIAICVHHYMTKVLLRYWVNPAEVEIEDMVDEVAIIGPRLSAEVEETGLEENLEEQSPQVFLQPSQDTSPPSVSTTSAASSPELSPSRPDDADGTGTRQRMGSDAVRDGINALEAIAFAGAKPRSRARPSGRGLPAAPTRAHSSASQMRQQQCQPLHHYQDQRPQPQQSAPNTNMPRPVDVGGGSEPAVPPMRPARPPRPNREAASPAPPPMPATQRARAASVAYVTPEAQRISVEVKPTLRYILSETTVQHLVGVLQAYLDTPDPASTKTQGSVETAKELKNFLQQYGTDYYSCLIGVPVARFVVDQAQKDKMADPLGCDARPGDVLLVRVANKQGKLVGLNAEKEKEATMVYARCKAVLASGLKVYTDVVLQNPSLVEPQYCYKLSSEFSEEFRRLGERDILLLEKYVDSPLKQLSRRLVQLTQDVTFEFIVKRGSISEASLRRAHRSEAVLADAYEILKAKSLLDDADTDLVVDLTADVCSAAHKTIRDFFVETSINRLFKPTLMREYGELAALYDIATVQAAVARFRNVCTSSLEQIKFTKRRLLQGALKKELTQWWLVEVQDRMNQFLVDRGFIVDALPEQYIESPPSDINHVKRNHQLLQEVLDPKSKYRDELLPQLESLKNLVYPRIDAFLYDTKAVLSSELRFDLMDFDIDEVSELYEIHKSNLDPQVSEWIAGTIKDIGYLDEMKKLEDPEYAKEKGTLHIVPISGLAISTLVIKEKEHKTALELWGSQGSSVKKEARYFVPSLALHQAITARETKVVDELMEKIAHSSFNINEQDSNGWTALHCAADDGQLKVCKRLLDAGADPNILTTGKNSALHFVAKKSFSDEKKQESLVKVAKKMLAKRASPSVKNSLGETPVHVACLLNSTRLVKALLAHPEAKINACTKKNETCLVYAVMARNQETVELLLQHGADLEVQTADGQTAMSLAIKQSHMEIVELLKVAFRGRARP